MTIKIGEKYLFTKSGNEVRVMGPANPYQGLPMFDVERVQAGSTGKRMNVPARALVKTIGDLVIT